MRNIALLMFLVCSTALTTAAGQPSHLKQVSLKVTVNANQQFSSPPGIPTEVTSDSLGPSYIDGQGNVSANLDTSGNLLIYLDSAAGGGENKPTPRQLGLYLGALIAPPTGGTSCTNLPAISPSNPPTYRSWIRTWPMTDGTYATAPAFQNMTVDASGNTVYYVDLDISFLDLNQTYYFFWYHQVTGPFVADGGQASRVQVRRLSSTKWVVEPVEPASLNGQPNIALLMEETIANAPHQPVQVTFTDCGFYQVPFSLTLEAQ